MTLLNSNMNELRIKTPTSRCLFGFARCDITPPIGIYHRFWGAARHDRATGIHRPLTATVMILAPLPAKGNSPNDPGLVVIAVDHCLFWPPEMEQVLQQTSELTGIERSRLIFTFSHSHSAGNTGCDRVELPGGDLIPPYMAGLPQKFFETYRQARESLRPSVFTYGNAPCLMGNNRDFWDETIGQFVCGFNPTETTHLEVGVVRISDDTGAHRATLVNYACHPTTLAWKNTLISPDYIGSLREVIETATDVPCIFWLAPCGDIGPRYGYVGDPAVADQNGRQVGYAALGALEGLPPAGTDFVYAGPVVSGATLGDWEYRASNPSTIRDAARFQFRNWQVQIPYRRDLPNLESAQQELKKFSDTESAARAAGNEGAARDARAMAERKRRLMTILSHLPKGPAYPLNLWAWRIGDAVWLAVPGEPYHWLQEELVRRFPNTPLIFAVIANGWASYLPEKSDYSRSLYQVEVAFMEPGCLEKVADEFSAQIRQWISGAK